VKQRSVDFAPSHVEGGPTFEQGVERAPLRLLIESLATDSDLDDVGQVPMS